MATTGKVLQRTEETSATTVIAGAGTDDVVTEIRDLLRASSDTLERILNDQDEIILLLGALLDVTAGDQPPSRTRSARTD